MRMRRKPWARPELDASDVYIKNPYDYFQKWQTAFANPYPMHLELGCGKGGFISQKAVLNPQINFLAFDIKSEVLAVANRNIAAQFVNANRPCDNIKLAAFDIERLFLVVGEKDKFDRLYINFCNPWPKDRHKKRRLTHPKQLKMYKTFLNKGAQIFFKTDDDMLFSDSVEYFNQSGYTIEFITYDMQASSLPDNIITEHEKMFMEQGVKIKGLIAKPVED